MCKGLGHIQETMLLCLQPSKHSTPGDKIYDLSATLPVVSVRLDNSKQVSAALKASYSRAARL
jgi:hypothetical protein